MLGKNLYSPAGYTFMLSRGRFIVVEPYLHHEDPCFEGRKSISLRGLIAILTRPQCMVVSDHRLVCE